MSTNALEPWRVQQSAIHDAYSVTRRDERGRSITIYDNWTSLSKDMAEKIADALNGVRPNVRVAAPQLGDLIFFAENSPTINIQAIAGFDTRTCTWLVRSGQYWYEVAWRTDTESTRRWDYVVVADEDPKEWLQYDRASEPA